MYIESYVYRNKRKTCVYIEIESFKPIVQHRIQKKNLEILFICLLLMPPCLVAAVAELYIYVKIYYIYDNLITYLDEYIRYIVNMDHR